MIGKLNHKFINPNFGLVINFDNILVTKNPIKIHAILVEQCTLFQIVHHPNAFLINSFNFLFPFFISLYKNRYK